jgi:hypothetical protein
MYIGKNNPVGQARAQRRTIDTKEMPAGVKRSMKDGVLF